MTSDKQHVNFKPSEILQRNNYGFNKIVADDAPGTDTAYARMEILAPWPKGMRKDTVMDYQPQVKASAQILTKAFDYAINGLRRPQEQFTIEVPVMHGLGDKPETNVSIFVYANPSAFTSSAPVNKDAPEKIKRFLQDNQKQISARVKEYLSQNQSQEI